MDMQKAVDAMLKIGDDERSRHMVTLGRLIGYMEDQPEHYMVKYDTGESPGELDSYRGYYCDLAIEPSGEPLTVLQFKAKLKEAVGQTFTGYKGGDYKMDETTPLWIAHYGDCSSVAIDTVITSTGMVRIITRHVEI